MAKCKRCGYAIQPHYTYCKKCFYELGSPYGTVLNNTNTHKCRKCGCEISGRYYYCPTCAKKLGFLN